MKERNLPIETVVDMRDLSNDRVDSLIRPQAYFQFEEGVMRNGAGLVAGIKVWEIDKYAFRQGGVVHFGVIESNCPQKMAQLLPLWVEPLVDFTERIKSYLLCGIITTIRHPEGKLIDIQNKHS